MIWDSLACRENIGEARLSEGQEGDQSVRSSIPRDHLMQIGQKPKSNVGSNASFSTFDVPVRVFCFKIYVD